MSLLELAHKEVSQRIPVFLHFLAGMQLPWVTLDTVAEVREFLSSLDPE